MFALRSGIQRSMAPVTRRLATASAPKNKLVPVSSMCATLSALRWDLKVQKDSSWILGWFDTTTNRGSLFFISSIHH